MLSKAPISFFRYFKTSTHLGVLLLLVAICDPSAPRDLVSQDSKNLTRINIASKEIHLRSGTKREWSHFPEESEGNTWSKEFMFGTPNQSCTLLIRQSDVRRDWQVELNGHKLGKLKKDQNDLVHHFEVEPKLLVIGKNRLTISRLDKKNSDDVVVGPVVLVSAPPKKVFQQSTLNISIKDLDFPDSKLPCRITIVDSNNSLVPLGIKSNAKQAVREGVVYTLEGKFRTGLPSGRYKIFANRGFEYSQDSRTCEIKPGETKDLNLGIRRVVDTTGWVSCDTHVHTLTHSGHGDCSIEERMVTLAGEGVELPIATDHNKQIDYRATINKTGTGEYFTPVIGNEVTTDFGHFNAFPFRPNSPIPDFRENDWSVLLPAIYKLGPKIAILNHGRDVHRGYRPLAPENFNSASGQSLNSRPFLFNAMEVINSAAQQTDQFQLFLDWMALTNGGHRVIPIGSSDSHDVNAFIVGQGRTYIEVDDSTPGAIDVDQAMKNLLKGRVSISCGLMARIKVNQKHGPGDLVAAASSISVECEMAGPSWLPATRMQLFENGIKVAEENFPLVDTNSKKGFVHRAKFKLKPKKHDSFLVLLASGPGYLHPSWRLSYPYQPTSPDWNPEIFGFTGATFIDADGNGKFNCARDYAKTLLKENKSDLQQLVNSLKDYDAAIATQAASLYQAEHGNLLNGPNAKVWRKGSDSVRKGFTAFLEAWRQSENARISK